jgi:branched-chain amino acid transport system substrate-binding protein
VSHLDRRQVLRIFGALAAAGVTGSASACSSSQPEGAQMEQPSGRTITVGLIAPALGAYAKVGDDITKGFKLYLTDHNYLVGRHLVDLRTAEEGATASSASAAVKGLLDQGVIALAGVANPAALAAVATAAEEAKVPLVSATASPSTFPGRTYTWRAASIEGEAGRALAPYARAVGLRTYILRDDTPSAAGEADEYSLAFKNVGGVVVGSSVGKGSYAARLQSARTLGADTIFASFTGADAVSLLDAYRSSNIAAKLLGPGSLTETADLTKFGILPQGVYTAMYYAPDLDNEENRRFVSGYHKAYGVQPTSYAMAAYDSASVLDQALRLLEGDLNSINLNRAFTLLGQIDSPRGPWTFNIKRSPQQTWYLRKLRLDGQVPANLLDTDLAVLS